MVGVGMIFDDTYRPFFENARQRPLIDRRFGVCEVDLVAIASRTGLRADQYRVSAGSRIGPFASYHGGNAIEQLCRSDADFVCVASPDHRHFAAARDALNAGKHVLIEKPSVLFLQELDELDRIARRQGKLCRVVYHKLFDPDHKKLRTFVADGQLRHVNNGYCSLLEPKQISGKQFAEWLGGRNPGTYVAVHYIKLIDFTFGGRLVSVSCSGQRGIVGPADGNTWDSTQLRLIYRYPDEREAAFDIHTSWVTPDNFPGYVEQEVQFRFDNGVWNGHSRRRGIECTIEGKTPLEIKITINNHYNGTFLEPFGDRSQRGYGIEVLEQFAREVACVEFGSEGTREQRLDAVRAMEYADISADRQVVAAVQAMEAILERHVAGQPDALVRVNDWAGGLVLYTPGNSSPEVLYPAEV
ncbi:MAG: Gfo/Idh/MocA family oxidoreductase [Planctomycetes bacterium]|nr:Gfo/Idh/MocA family oxidoreductase [Planctomycetota bacterium]